MPSHLAHFSLLQVSSYLFQRTCPLRLLLPEHVSAMVREWSGLLVVSATPLPRPLVEAMLRAGVKVSMAVPALVR